MPGVARHGLLVSEGKSREGGRLLNLTPLGRAASAQVQAGRRGMGGIACDEDRSGAPQVMVVNETAIAITRTPVVPTRIIPDSHGRAGWECYSSYCA